MKRFIKLLLLLLLPVFVLAQSGQKQLTSLQLELKNAANDTIRMDVYLQLAKYFNEINSDSSLIYLEQCLPIARKLKLKLYEASVLENRGYILTKISNYPKALETFLQALKIAEDPVSEKNVWNLPDGLTPHNKRLNILGIIHLTLGHLFGATGNTDKQISSYLQAKSLGESVQDHHLNVLANMNLGGIYLKHNKLDSALLFEQIALGLISKPTNSAGKYDGGVLNLIGKIYQEKGDFDLAMEAFQKALKLIKEQNNLNGLGWIYISLSSFYQTINKPDSSLIYANKGLKIFKAVGNSRGIAGAYYLLSSVYGEQNRTDSAFVYLKLATALNDSLHNVERKNLLAYQNVGFSEQLRLKNLEDEKIQLQTKIRTYAMLAGIVVFMLITFLLYRNNRYRRKANELLQKQKEEIAGQKENVEQTLVELKSTQSQLIQAEKMASLGELTAGIAHEIQNPLNFVNNFAEVSKELAEELNEEVLKTKIDTELISEIAGDLVANQEKINHHGQRASGIVKGMLEHSRTSTGKKELTDINVLADEYLRLAYHGLRAKDKSFNADFKLDLDESLPKINVVSQDIGRVLLNLINNAFYTVSEALSAEQAGSSPNDNTYKPEVEVRTEKAFGKIMISVKDNGKGIPEHVRDKIFQPFFTTKPTGSGTGLGLSLSYDIITKGHNGELVVETEEGKGTEFKIILPVV